MMCQGGGGVGCTCLDNGRSFFLAERDSFVLGSWRKGWSTGGHTLGWRTLFFHLVIIKRNIVKKHYIKMQRFVRYKGEEDFFPSDKPLALDLALDDVPG